MAEAPTSGGGCGTNAGSHRSCASRGALACRAQPSTTPRHGGTVDTCPQCHPRILTATPTTGPKFRCVRPAGWPAALDKRRGTAYCTKSSDVRPVLTEGGCGVDRRRCAALPPAPVIQTQSCIPGGAPMSASYRVAIIGTGRMGGLIDDELAPRRLLQALRPLQRLRRDPRDDDRRGRQSRRRAPGALRAALRGREDLPRLPRDDRARAAGYRQRDDAILGARRADHLRGGARGARDLRREGALRLARGGRPDRRRPARRNKVAFNWGAMRRHDDGFRPPARRDRQPARSASRASP